MHLMMIPFNNTLRRKEIEGLLERNSHVKDITWLNVSRKTPERIEDRPQVVGSLKGLLGYSDQEMLHLVVEGQQNARALARQIKLAAAADCSAVYTLPLLKCE